MGLYALTTTKLYNGAKAGDGFTNRILFKCSLAPGAQEFLKLADDYALLERPLLDSGFTQYSVTISPIEVPGRRKLETNNHVIRIINKPGAHAQEAQIDPALLTVCAVFNKYATMGTPGQIKMRGVLTETELKSDEGGNPINSDKPDNDAINERFRTYATGVKALFEGVGGGALIMPGRPKNKQGEIVTLQQYEASARLVGKVEFDGFEQVQLSKSSTSIDSKKIVLMRSMAKRLESVYADAVEAAAISGEGIPSETTADLTEIGKEIFRMFNNAQRQKLRLPAKVKAYIKA